jgi:hypothetical protein
MAERLTASQEGLSSMEVVSSYCHVLSDYRRVLDWKLDLLDHNQLHNSVTVYYTLQLTTTVVSLFSYSEDPGSNSATTAATNSYGVPCHYSLTAAAPLLNTNSLIP